MGWMKTEFWCIWKWLLPFTYRRQWTILNSNIGLQSLLLWGWGHHFRSSNMLVTPEVLWYQPASDLAALRSTILTLWLSLGCRIRNSGAVFEGCTHECFIGLLIYFWRLHLEIPFFVDSLGWRGCRMTALAVKDLKYNMYFFSAILFAMVSAIRFCQQLSSSSRWQQTRLSWAELCCVSLAMHNL